MLNYRRVSTTIGLFKRDEEQKRMLMDSVSYHLGKFDHDRTRFSQALGITVGNSSAFMSGIQNSGILQFTQISCFRKENITLMSRLWLSDTRWNPHQWCTLLYFPKLNCVDHYIMSYPSTQLLPTNINPKAFRRFRASDVFGQLRPLEIRKSLRFLHFCCEPPSYKGLSERIMGVALWRMWWRMGERPEPRIFPIFSS